MFSAIFPERVSTRSKSALFNMQMPLKRSFIMEDGIIEQNKSMKTLKVTSQGKGSLDMRNSGMFQSKIIYPKLSFMARKIKRIVSSHLLESFNMIKRKRKICINLDLLNSKIKRNFHHSFLQIRLFVQSSKGQSLQRLINRNKTPTLIFQAIFRTIKGREKNGFDSLNKCAQQKKKLQIFSRNMESLIKTGVQPFFKRLFLRRMKQYVRDQETKSKIVPKLIFSIQRAINRSKVQTFRKIVQNICFGSYQSVTTVKKTMAEKLNEATVQKAKILMQQKQKLRNFKSDLDMFSADSAKSRYEIRRDLNTYRAKLKEEQKKTKKMILELTNDNFKLEQKLNELELVLRKRFSKNQNQGNEKFTKQIYQDIFEQKANQVGEIRLKNTNKALLQLNREQVLGLEEFHVYQNQKLRQQIGLYENWLVSDSMWPEQQVIFEQNKNLKQIMKCLISRQYDLFVYKTDQKQQEKQVTL